ncbi:MAG: pyrroloquinoline-quinone synthase PqqC [Acidobacteriota bacterium]
MMGQPLPFDQFVQVLREQGFRRYHHQHPFHRLMNSGQLTRAQLQGWLINRFYYQSVIPLKDAAILSNCPIREVRRQWIRRIADHDGSPDKEQSGIEAWLGFGEAMGLERRQILEAEVLPGVRFACDAYVHFCKTHSWLEGIAASLTEMYASSVIQQRLASMEEHYSWIEPKGFSYFRWRLEAAQEDATQALAILRTYCQTEEEQQRSLQALIFKTEILWSFLDAVHLAACGKSPEGSC